jgi:acetyl-CoA synthetase
MSSGRYEDIYSSFKWNVPEYYNFGFDVVDKWAEDRTKLALVSLDEKQTKATFTSFHELKVLSNQFANTLARLGINKGERVLVILQSIPEWYTCVVGMIKAGVVFMPGTGLLTEKDIIYRLGRSEAAMVITDSHHAELVDKAARQCPSLKQKMIVRGNRDGWVSFEDEMVKSPTRIEAKAAAKTKSSDPILIYFTSGTTGNPKMVLHTHSYPIGHEVTARFAQALTDKDLHWTVSDTGWAKCSWGKLFGQMIVGTAIIQWETPGRFDPDGLLRAMERYGVTTFCAPPTVYRMLIQLDLSKYQLRLRHCTSAGEPLNPEVIKTWKDAFGVDIYDIFGQSETVCVLANFPFMPIRYGSVGKSTPGHDMRIVDDEGRELPPDEEGHISMRLAGTYPPGLFKEYWKDPDEMAKSFHHGFYFTGDRGYKDADGYFWFVGRGDDIIKSSGYRIGPFEVESALLEHPAVAESAVVGVEDPEGTRGVLVKAFIVLAKGYEPSDKLTKELQDHVKKTTAPYKYPRLIQYMKDLPKTVSGKILRRELRKLG